MVIFDIMLLGGATYNSNEIRRILLISFAISIVFIFFASLRHSLFHSNAYDLGLFDQWLWLLSNKLPPYSSMEGVHVLVDHGAWVLYLAAIPYWFMPSVNWLFAGQAIALSFTSIPLYLLAKQAGLNSKYSWLVCCLWWLQPVVFNVNIFDFHPEVLAMPVLAFTYWADRSNKPLLWFLLLVFLLGCRDGLILVLIGIGLEQAVRKKWMYSFAAVGLSAGWLAFLNRYLYPVLSDRVNGPKAATSLFSYLGNSFDEILINLFLKPNLILQNIDFVGGFWYLIFLILPILFFLRKTSFPILIGALPLVIVNLLSQESPQRTLIHHYSLPIAVIFIVAVIEGLKVSNYNSIPWKLIAFSAICWASLAKPWFFTGPYLSRIQLLGPFDEIARDISEESSVITTSYFVPHLTHREKIIFPNSFEILSDLNQFNFILLNPKDPGWGSTSQIQEKVLDQAKKEGWRCYSYPQGLETCSLDQ